MYILQANIEVTERHEMPYFLLADPCLLSGKELFGLDTLHKVLWIKLLEEMFLGMPSEYPWGDEMMLFLNVFNGALLLHPEDSALLRQYTATAINTAVHFNHLFSLSGYQWILPTMLQVPLFLLLFLFLLSMGPCV